MFDIIALHALFGSSIPIGKYLLRYAPPIFLTGIRMAIAGTLLVGFNLLRKKQMGQIPRQLWWQYLQLIVVGVYLKYILRTWGLAHMPAIKMAFMLNITPFVSAYFSYLAFRETLTRRQWLGIFVGVIGSIPLLVNSSTTELAWGELFYISWPELAIFAAVMANSYSLIISRTLVREHAHPASLTNGVRMLGGGILALLTAFFVEPLYITDPGRFFGWLAILILVSNIICHNFYLRLLKRYSVTFISLTDFLSPLFIALYSWAFLHELITWHYVASGAVVLLGVYLFYGDEVRGECF